MNAGTVLLAEDVPALRSLIRRMLVEAGYEVLVARNGAEALQHCQSHKVDVVLTDVHKPYLDGVSLVQRLCGQRNSPAFLVTSTRRLEGRLPTGAVFLRRPFTRAELLDHVRLLTLCERAGVGCEA